MGVAGSDVERIFQLQFAGDKWSRIEEAIKRLTAYPAWGDEAIAPVLNTNVLDQIRDGLKDWATNKNQPVLDAYYLSGNPRPE